MSTEQQTKILVKKIEPVGFAANSYIVTIDGKTCIVIDPSQPRIVDELQRLNLKCEYVLLTHGHFDHVGGVKACRDLCAKVISSERERDYIFSNANLSIFGGVEIPYFEIDKMVNGGDILELCGLEVEVIETPGHTEGSVCFKISDCIFSGDTLFRGSVGRCDLPTGNAFKIIESVKKLYNLKGDYKVYCGHDDDTTLDYERKNNIYVREN